jgi:hypothetical protein
MNRHPLRSLDRWPGHPHDDWPSRWLWRLTLACMLVAILAAIIGALT